MSWATYVGVRDEKNRVQVWVLREGLSYPLNARQDLRRHSPDGFNWGYGGSGPAQLAIAMLCDWTEDADVAFALYQRFKWEIIALLPKSGWVLDHTAIEEWVIRKIGAYDGPIEEGAIELMEEA